MRHAIPRQVGSVPGGRGEWYGAPSPPHLGSISSGRVLGFAECKLLHVLLQGQGQLLVLVNQGNLRHFSQQPGSLLYLDWYLQWTQVDLEGEEISQTVVLPFGILSLLDLAPLEQEREWLSLALHMGKDLALKPSLSAVAF
ncbi:MAG: hypothetical protein RMJ98_00095 [Myxococcales bacterium]|nr:hypothetical protein [Polyangiaceae bacterium]MDW8247686.1 hypothetical protein [Myxococcales bacterium]